MPLGIVFWVLMIVWLVFGGWRLFASPPEQRYFWGGSLLVFVLFFLLGWKVFGFIVQG